MESGAGKGRGTMKRCARCFYEGAHTCEPKPSPTKAAANALTSSTPAANTKPDVAKPAANKGRANLPEVSQRDERLDGSSLEPSNGYARWRIRDVEKRRTYMREHMRRLRAELKRQRAQ